MGPVALVELEAGKVVELLEAPEGVAGWLNGEVKLGVPGLVKLGPVVPFVNGYGAELEVPPIGRMLVTAVP